MVAHIENSQNDCNQQNNTQGAAEKPQLLANGGKDKVGVLLRNIAGLNLGAVKQPLTGQPAAGNGIQGACSLIAEFRCR